MSDQPHAATLGEAALNPDGKTYNGAKALKWLFEAVNPGKTISETEINTMFDAAKAKAAAKRGEPK